MTTVATVIERVRRIRGLRGTQTEVARVLGTTPKSLDCAKCRNRMPTRTLQNWCAAEGIDYETLIGDNDNVARRQTTGTPERLPLSQGSMNRLFHHYGKHIVELYGVGRNWLLMVTNEGEKIETTADIYARIVGYQTKGRDND